MAQGINLQDEVSRLSREKNEPEWMLQRRLEALRRFEELPTPSQRYGLNIFVNLDFDFSDINFSKIKKIEINKFNNKNLIVKDLGEALNDAKLNIQEYFKDTFDDKFEAFHSAFWNKGLVIIVPENSVVNEPIKFKNLIKQPNEAEYIIIIAKKNSKLNFVDMPKSDSWGYRSQVVEIFVEENAKVNYVTIQNLDEQRRNFVLKRGHVKRDGELNWFDFCFGSKWTKSLITTYLDEDGAVSNNYGVFFGDNEQKFDLYAKTIHTGAHTICDMHTKGVLNGKAQSLYRGYVKIEKEAFGSNGYQKEETLLLSEDAEADAIPSLEIDNHDVRCTHGTTIGKIDEEKLFYLMSRGLKREEAEQKIVEGYFYPILKKMEFDDVKENVQELVAVKARCN